jgi:hypothetical protein
MPAAIDTSERRLGVPRLLGGRGLFVLFLIGDELFALVPSPGWI